MEANELRIGNYVNLLNFVTDNVTEMQIDYDDFENMVHQNHLLYRAIPLTEQWLLKFGFEKMPLSEYTLNTYIKDGVKLWDKHEDFSYLLFEYLDGIKIEFVHQLQNLYFALRGEELPVENWGNNPSK